MPDRKSNKRDGSSAAERGTHNSRRGRSIRPRPISELVGGISPSAANRLEGVKLIRHKTARSLWMAQLQPLMDEYGIKDPNDVLCEGKHDADYMVKNVLEANGFWAFAEPERVVVQAWWKPSTSREQLLALLAHELEHIVRKCRNFRGLFEERRCDLTGAIAARAWQLLGEKDA